MKRVHMPVLLAIALMTATACQARSAPDDLTKIAEQIDDGNSEEAESTLLMLRERNPKDPGVPTLLARIAYLRAVSGLAQYPGMPPTGWDQAEMDQAEKRVREAIGIDPKYAYAWVIHGQIKYARYQLAESLQMLEQAEALDPSSVKLRLRKGATLRALASYRGDDSLLDASLAEYRRAIKGDIDDGNERLAASEMSEIFVAQGEFDKARTYLSDALATSQGREKAILLDKRANARLRAGDVDNAIVDSHAALEQMDFGVGRQTLASALIVKSGTFMRDGDPAKAADAAMESMQTGADIGGVLPILAGSPNTFPAVYAFLQPDIKESGGGQYASAALCSAADFVSRKDLERLKSLGADFDVVDPQQGTLLHCAIAANNVDAVKALLDLGADTGIRHPDGHTVLEATLIGTSPPRRDIRRLVLAKVGTPSGWKEPEVDLPIKHRWYKAERAIGAATHSVVPAGAILMSGGNCRFQDRTDICLSFYRKPGDYFGTVAVPLSQLADLKALHEVPAPAEPETPKPSAP